MTAEEALAVVQYLAASYRTEVTTQTIAVWADHLRGVSANVGMQAAQELSSSSQFMPHPSEFLTHARRVARRVGEQQQALPESTGPRTGRERALAHVAELRRVVAAAAPRVASPAPTKPDRERTSSFSLTPCPYCSVVDGVQTCGGSIADRHRRPEADRAATPEPTEPS